MIVDDYNLLQQVLLRVVLGDLHVDL